MPNYDIIPLATDLREAKVNQELAKMGQMAQQIAEALARNP